MKAYRLRRLVQALASGAILLGWLQGWQMTNFSSVLTQFLIQFFTSIFAILMGGNAQSVLST